MSDTMRVWDAVSKTNPKNTKHVNQRGGFTSICAQSQIMEATRQFGPIGEGWGYSASPPIFHDRLVFVQVTLWHGEFNRTYGPMTGGCEWQDKNGRLDSDAIKKATTDAITKLLGQLGFNADVFLGLFDDNKYVETVRREFEEREKSATPKITDDQKTELMAHLDAMKVPVAEFLKISKITDLGQLPADKFEGAKGWITQNAKQKENA